MTRPGNRSARSARLALRLLAVALLGLPMTLPSFALARSAVAMGSQPAPEAATAVGPDTGTPTSVSASAPDGQSGLLSPTIQYLDALVHADDVIDFPPGDRVTVGFTPRVGDAWEVGGGKSKALPPGRVSGTALHAAAQGSVWTGTPAPSRNAIPPAPSPGSVPVDGAIGPSIAGATVSTAGSSADGSAFQPDAVVSANGLRREVFGFLPYWEVSDSSTSLNWSVLSTVAYFSVGADQNGNLLKKNSDGSVTTGWGGWTSSKMTSIINAAHQRGTRVVLTITCFAWTTGQQTTQANLLGNPTARSNLAKQIAAAVAERGADGVNLDFEPIVSGYADEFTALVRSVRAELNAIAPGYQLTFDTTGYIGNYPLEAATAPGGADAIFIMGYDYRGSSATQAGSISPLTGPVYDLTDTVSAYAARVSPSKLILGVPYYGRAWSTDSDQLHAKNISGTQYGTSVTVLYETAADLATQYGRRYDAIEQAPWTAYQKQTCTTTYGCVTAWRQLYYDDAATLKLRYDLINRTGLRGAGIWALGYDGARPELYQALADKFLHDTTAPLVGVIALSITQRDAGFEVRWAGTDESSMGTYDVQVSTDGGVWTDWRMNTTATSSIFLGLDGHAYAFRARGRDSHNNLSAWNVTSTATDPSLTVGGFGTVLLDGLKLRAGAGTSAAIVGTINTYDAVAVTGGPVSADGYTWYEVSAPVRQWSPVDPVETGVWVAASSSTTTYVAPRRPINATGVTATLAGYGVGSGGTRIVTPNGDGITDTIRLTWSMNGAIDSLALNIWRADGTLAGTQAVSGTDLGAHTFDWNAKVGSTTVADGTYLLQLVATKGAVISTAPSAKPVSPEQLAQFGVTVDHMPVTRLGGADRYATAVAVSA
ncbi:MAG: glycosyl hydrolase family 18 protein, partial [Chloroflexota bacterium]